MKKQCTGESVPRAHYIRQHFLMFHDANMQIEIKVFFLLNTFCLCGVSSEKRLEGFMITVSPDPGMSRVVCRFISSERMKSESLKGIAFGTRSLEFIPARGKLDESTCSG